MKTMTKTDKVVRLLWIGWLMGIWLTPSLSAAQGEGGTLSGIKVEIEKNETNVLIEGGYKSFRAFSLPNPARLVVDFEGTGLGKDVPTAIEVQGEIISKIRVGRGDGRVRMVLDSAEKDEPFHYNIGKKNGQVRIKAWRPVRQAAARTPDQTGEGKYSYPPQFPKKELSELLGLSSTRTAEKKEEKKLPKYPGVKIQTIDFYQEDLHNVFRLFGEITGKNFIVDDSVKGTLTLSLRDVPWDLAMEIIADMENLKQEEREGILVIRPKDAKKDGKDGELVVKKFPEHELYPARVKQKEKQEEQEARELILKAHNLEKEGDITGALQVYEKAVNLSKSNIELMKKTAYLHYSLEHFAKANFYAKEALKLNTQDPEAALYAALSASQMGKRDEAKLFFEAAVHSKPHIPEAFYNYGLFLELTGNVQYALYIYKRYEELFGPALDVSLATARLYESGNKAEDACRIYREISYSGFSLDPATEGMVAEKVRTLCD